MKRIVLWTCVGMAFFGGVAYGFAIAYPDIHAMPPMARSIGAISTICAICVPVVALFLDMGCGET